MKRLRLYGLVIATALLAACAARDPMATSQELPSTRPFASKPLLRLANYEQNSKTDIVSHVDVEPADTQRHLSPKDEVAKITALWHAISDGAVGRQVAWSNLDTGSHGFAEVMREVPIPESDRVCREYREAFVVAGRNARDVGQVCQLRDGSWWKIQG
jgi:surface antigen